MNNNYPEVISYIGEDGNNIKELKLDTDSDTHDILLVPVNRQVYRKWLNPWLAKQASALWYKHSGRIVSTEDRVAVRWLNSEQFLKDGIPSGLLDNLPKQGMMETGKRSMSHLYSYRYAISDDRTFGAFLISFRDAVLGFSSIAPREFFQKFASEVGFGEMFVPVAGFGLQRCLEGPVANP